MSDSESSVEEIESEDEDVLGELVGKVGEKLGLKEEVEYVRKMTYITRLPSRSANRKRAGIQYQCVGLM